ncbi:MAG TPA: glutathione ABC transporter substrate-binding protein [Thermotogota bacterium]|nr:glutathione ABC transporter substrate-binding protein [Thermotogota bacterium]HRW93075.1 glutathione ABC transporter substrate-binding protein [Thermotogota bacterium]
MKKFLVVAFFVSLFAVFGFAENYGGDFVYAMGADAVTLLPANMSDNPSEAVCRHIFDGLVEFAEDMEIVPALAKSWEISEDGTVYTFHLQQGVKFHDGAAFNAQAVKTYFDWIVASNVKRTSLYEPYIKQINVVDENTVEFVLHFSFGGFTSTLAHGAGLIVSPAMIAKYGDDVGELGKHPSGTGPFALEVWKRAEVIQVRANEDYWKGRPYLDSIEFRVIPEDITRVIQVQSGDADLTMRVPPIMKRRLEGDKNLTLRNDPSLRVIYLGFNMRKAPLDNVLVRQAFNYAIDKEKLCSVIMRGLATPSDSPLSPNTWGYAPTGGYPYDPAKARELLKQAGYDELDIVLSTPRGRYLQDYETIIAVQAMLADSNINADVQPMEWGEYINFLFTEPENSNYEVFLLGWAPSTGDADWVLRPLFSSDNLPPSGDNNTFYNNPKVDELIQAGMRESDPEARHAIYAEAQQIIVEDAGWAFLYNLNQLVVFNNKVQGVEVLPIEIVLVKNAWFEN